MVAILLDTIVQKQTETQRCPQFNNNLKTKAMKTKFRKTVPLFLLGILIASCSKNDDSDSSSDTRLVLPAVLENTTQLIVPDAIRAPGNCGSTTTPGNAENTIEITADGIIANAAKVSIEVDIDATFGGEVVLELITPSGQSAGLIKRIGADADVNCGLGAKFITGNKLTFNSANATLLVAPYPTGNYAPTSGASTFPAAVAMTPLATFLTGKNIKGTWKMKMYDCGVLDRVKLNSWKLKFDTGALQ